MSKWRNRTSRKAILFFVLVCVLGSILGLVISLKSRMQLGSTQLLVDHVQNFDNLKLDDLPSLYNHSGYYSAIYDYGNHKIEVGNGRIVEYDSTTNAYIRMSDRNVLGSFMISSAKIADNLYISFNATQKVSQNNSLPYGTLNKIDLRTGKIVKKYFQDILPLPTPIDLNRRMIDYKGRKVNLRLVSKDNFLWMSSDDGIMRMDTTTDNIISYTSDQVFGSGCFPGGIFNDDGKITVLASMGSQCGGAVSVLDENNNKWNATDFGTDSEKAYEAETGYIKNHGFYKEIFPPANLPDFYYVAPKKDGKYYIVASNGIYTLEKDQFPKILFNGKVDFQLSNGRVKSYFSKDNRYLLLLDPLMTGGGDSAQVFGFGAYLIDFSRKSIVNLMSDREFHENLPINIEQIDSEVEGGVFEESNNIVFLKNSSDGSILVSVDLDSSKLTFGH